MDILTIARERQGALRAEIAEIDEFIRMGERLLRSVGTAVEPRTHRPDRDEGVTKVVDAGRADGAELLAEPETIEQAGTVEQTRNDEQVETSEQSETAEQAESTDRDLPAAEAVTASEPLVRRFPWSNAQPPMRSTGSDDTTGPTRRNLMRRQAS